MRSILCKEIDTAKSVQLILQIFNLKTKMNEYSYKFVSDAFPAQKRENIISHKTMNKIAFFSRRKSDFQRYQAKLHLFFSPGIFFPSCLQSRVLLINILSPWGQKKVLQHERKMRTNECFHRVLTLFFCKCEFYINLFLIFVIVNRNAVVNKITP